MTFNDKFKKIAQAKKSLDQKKKKISCVDILLTYNSHSSFLMATEILFDLKTNNQPAFFLNMQYNILLFTVIVFQCRKIHMQLVYGY